ncbi:UNVERIFIED_ORG: putative nuclease with RNAse H fold/dephospho-CoA kinase [Methylorubrum zatmanii]
MVTFNGKLFDVPFLQQEFPGIELPDHHVDLRFAARRLGLVGGQKAIEVELGADTRDGVAGDGAAAVLLWHRYLRGDIPALRELIAYNRADVRGMAVILDHLIASWGLQDGLFAEAYSFTSRFMGSAGTAEAGAVLPPPGRLGKQPPTYGDLFGEVPTAALTIVGVDLTGSQTKPSGVATLTSAHATTTTLASDDEIVAYVVAAQAALVSIDSPLSLPSGRRTAFDDDPGRAEFGIMRACERELKRRGINVYPCLLPSMQRLTARGIALADRIRRLGIPVIESYPGAAQDILGIPRKGAGPEWLAAGLAAFGLSGDFAADRVSHDELDAITSALVGTFFLAGRFEALAGPKENALIVPLLRPSERPLVLGVSGRIAAGKTTLARELEDLGFAYTRFSQVIDDELRAAGRTPDRVSRQEFGMLLHETRGQRWLCERVLERAGDAGLVVVDGLRWIDDATYFHERLGPNFVHVHVDAGFEVRAARFISDGTGRTLTEADMQPVEREIEALGRLASTRIVNEGGLDELRQAARDVAGRLLGTGARACRSR